MARHTRREIIDREAIDDDVYELNHLPNGRVRLTPSPTHVIEGKEGTKVNAELLQPYEDFLESLKNEDANLQDSRGLVASNEDLIATENNLNERITSEVGTLNTTIGNEVSTLNTRIDGEVETLENEIKSEVDRLGGRIDDNYLGILANRSRIGLLEGGVAHLNIIHVKSENMPLLVSNFQEVIWEPIRISNPAIFNLEDNSLRPAVSGLTVFHSTLTITAPRTTDVILYTETRATDVVTSSARMVIPQGTEPISITGHVELIDAFNFRLFLRTSHDIEIAKIESVVSFTAIGDTSTNALNLSDASLEANDPTLTTQFELNVEVNRRLNNIVEEVGDGLQTVNIRTDNQEAPLFDGAANQRDVNAWTHTQVQHLSNTRPANGHSASFNNLGVAGELHLQRNNQTSLRIGDDAWIGDANIANGFRVSGQQNPNQGVIQFGNGARIQNDTPSDLSINSNLILTGNIAAGNLISQPWQQRMLTGDIAGANHFTFGLNNNAIPQGVRMFYLVFTHPTAGTQEHFCLIPPTFRANATFPHRVVEMRDVGVGTANFNRLIFQATAMAYNFANGTFTLQVGVGSRHQQTGWASRTAISRAITIDLIAV